MKQQNDSVLNIPMVFVGLAVLIMGLLSGGILFYDLVVRSLSFASHGSHWLFALSVTCTIVFFRYASFFYTPTQEENHGSLQIVRSGKAEVSVN